MLRFDIYTYQFAPLVDDAMNYPTLFEDLPTREKVMASKKIEF